MIKACYQPYLYLDREPMRAKDLDQAEMEKAVPGTFE